MSFWNLSHAFSPLCCPYLYSFHFYYVLFEILGLAVAQIIQTEANLTFKRRHNTVLCWF